MLSCWLVSGDLRIMIKRHICLGPYTCKTLSSRCDHREQCTLYHKWAQLKTTNKAHSSAQALSSRWLPVSSCIFRIDFGLFKGREGSFSNSTYSVFNTVLVFRNFTLHLSNEYTDEWNSSQRAYILKGYIYTR